ncbi:MAG: hypothetical protein J6V41_07690 [Kiritimatiellae bacterium]|nr:hypothetical protein [Kiritimatiellia bacterium]
MLESIIVILTVCLVLFGLLQVAIVYTGQEVLHHAAARAARARAVGFNDWMVHKAVKVAVIPNSGERLEPITPNYVNSGISSDATPGEAMDIAFSRRPVTSSPAAGIESARIPEYLASENYGRSSYILNYEEWERGSISYDVDESLSMGGGIVKAKVQQDFPLKMPFASYFYPFASRRDENNVPRISIQGEGVAGNHSAVYLEK